ncbi:sensor histidine kinase [Saccharopolyspora rosea]|uniref:sensor histidine kinase n=1 Tax=Saccharopolyspora rosea TaxID=524884 RepID=UPI0021DB7A79|nr:histidine kinase [Saccharopolyspora rosea]
MSDTAEITAPTSLSERARWWRRAGSLLSEQWMFALLLGVALAFDGLMLTDLPHGVFAFPGAVLLAVLALLGRRHPVRAGLAAAVVLAGSAVLTKWAHTRVYSVGLVAVLPTENLAGLLLVAYLFRARSPRRAVPVTALLVAVCLGTMAIRSTISTSVSEETSLGFGFLQLVLAIGSGLYMRQGPVLAPAPDSPLRALVRRQWPVIAAQSMLLFLDAVSGRPNVAAVGIVLLCGLVMSTMAVFAPRRPVETSMLAALALALAAPVMRLLGFGASAALLGGIPASCITAAMVLVAYASRFAPPRGAGAAVGALGAAAVFVMVLTPGHSPAKQLAESLFVGALLLVISVGTGVYFRARDRERARTVQVAVDQAQQAERMALARELHDVVAHHVTGIVVQAQAAQLVAERNPQAASDSLARIADSGTEALTAMRRLVASMRGSEPAGASEATEQATTDLTSDLRALVDAAGHDDRPRVELDAAIDHPVPPEVARSVLRLVQESLTNAEKHALDATRVQVDVRSADSWLRISVSDDGTGVRAQPVGGSGGYGLVGMRERVELLGGRLHAGPGEHIGWRVEAELPLDRPSGADTPDRP